MKTHLSCVSTPRKWGLKPTLAKEIGIDYRRRDEADLEAGVEALIVVTVI
jgi:hypothetical protein